MGGVPSTAGFSHPGGRHPLPPGVPIRSGRPAERDGGGSGRGGYPHNEHRRGKKAREIMTEHVRLYASTYDGVHVFESTAQGWSQAGKLDGVESESIAGGKDHPERVYV